MSGLTSDSGRRADPLPAGLEIESAAELMDALARGIPPARLRLQDLDLRSYEALLLPRRDLGGLVVLGGQLSRELDAHLRAHGAIVFPAHPSAAPINPYRAGLYTADELYTGLDQGYEGTLDARAYGWALDGIAHPDVYATLLRAIHDDAVTDALAEFIGDQPVVGVMGGHAITRDTPAYAAAARLGHDLANRGFLVATGGGPGAMEAANLGAAAADPVSLTAALAAVAEVPDFRPSITEWARAGFRARDLLGDAHLHGIPGDVPSPAAHSGAGRGRSLGVPTWFYGHEPPNIFAQGIAKYFSNALREDGLLARADAGIIVLPGAAGTVQEVFQAVTPLYYTSLSYTRAEELPPLILVDRDHWHVRIPVWATLVALARGRPMERAIHLVDDPVEAVGIIAGQGAVGGLV